MPARLSIFGSSFTNQVVILWVLCFMSVWHGAFKNVNVFYLIGDVRGRRQSPRSAPVNQRVIAVIVPIALKC
jgi:hypothetical protein